MPRKNLKTKQRKTKSTKHHSRKDLGNTPKSEDNLKDLDFGKEWFDVLDQVPEGHDELFKYDIKAEVRKMYKELGFIKDDSTNNAATSGDRVLDQVPEEQDDIFKYDIKTEVRKMYFKLGLIKETLTTTAATSEGSSDKKTI